MKQNMADSCITVEMHACRLCVLAYLHLAMCSLKTLQHMKLHVKLWPDTAGQVMLSSP